jgi:hypothetical protein
MSTHTPGPWMVEPHADDDEVVYVCANYTVRDGVTRATWIAECDLQDGNLPENHANARLIAAAPDLLKACKAAIAELITDLSQTADYLRAAIAKAEGR